MKKYILLFLVLICGCTPEQTTFHYQLQDTQFETLQKLNVDILIIDPDDSGLAAEEIHLLKQYKTVLAYLSIGEAEEYRRYWNKSWQVGTPSFIDDENPDWEGNYKVRYWDPRWQTIVLQQVERIRDLGYDGLYLDVIDAYEYYPDVPGAREAMVAFVKKIAHTDMMLFTQNAVELYDDYSLELAGIGVEDTWYDDDHVQDADHTRLVLEVIQTAKEDGKQVLAIDYPDQRTTVCSFYDYCLAQDIACVVSTRDLDKASPLICP